MLCCSRLSPNFPPHVWSADRFVVLGKNMDPAALNNLSPEQAEGVIQQIKQNAATAANQEIIQNATKMCYLRCVPSPGAVLSKKEEGCLAMCFDRYLETMQVVSQALQDHNN